MKPVRSDGIACITAVTHQCVINLFRERMAKWRMKRVRRKMESREKARVEQGAREREMKYGDRNEV